jgi:diketogulonate reductase-like aldo/keto reductase
MQTNIQSTAKLNNGVHMPWFGLGVFRAKEGREVQKAVKWALEAGYRSIDTAAGYGNEAGVGKAIRDSGVPRDEVFVTTKVTNQDQRSDRVEEAFESSLKLLGMDYVDLYLVHWPVEEHYKRTWSILEDIYKSGKARSIGVSNFLLPHLHELLPEANVVPTVNQIEMHPYLQQPELIDFCRQEKIQVEAWSPLMKGKVLDVPELKQLGKKYGKNEVQIALRWLLQKEIVAIPKSVKKSRIQDNAKVFDFEITAEDMALIDSLDRSQRVGPDPLNFNF